MTGSRGHSWPRWTSRLAGPFSALVGMLVLCGWEWNIDRLKSMVLGWPPMAPLAAFSFLLAGAALFCSSFLVYPSSRRFEGKSGFRFLTISHVCAVLLIVIAGLRLGEYFLGWRLSSIELFHPAPTVSMSPASAFNFLFVGVALLLRQHARAFRVFQTLALLTAFLGWMGFSKYLYETRPVFVYVHMAVHAAIAFLFLSAGVLCLRTDRGLMSLLTSDSQGGIICRRLLLPAMVVPVTMGWIRLQGQRAGLYGTAEGVSLFALSNVIVFGGLVWAAAAALHRTDERRREAVQKTSDQLVRLDLLRQITQATSEHQDLRSIFQVMIRRIEENLPVDFAAVCLYDPVGRSLSVAHVGVRNGALRLLSEPIEIDGNGFSPCRSGELVYETDISRMPSPLLQELSRLSLCSMVTSPFMVDSQLFGVLVVCRKGEDSFSSQECAFVKHLTEHVSGVIHQTQLFSSLQRAYDDLRSTQQVLMQQERLRAFGQMAAGIAHDISNSVLPVTLSIEILKQSEESLSPNARDLLETMQRAMSDVKHTLRQMKDLYRQREPQTKLVPVQLNELVEQTKELTHARWHTVAQQRGAVIRMQTELAPELPKINGVESEIREALINLVFNAADAMPRGGAITLKTGREETRNGSSDSRKSGSVYVEVIDSGAGMNEETLRRCMEPFYTTKGEEGTGLGLAMVHSVAERHGAGITISSVLGEGTTIRMTFPLAPVKVTNRPQLEAPAEWSSQKILVVDDDPILLQVLCEILTRDGHRIVTADSGQAGIDAFSAAQKSPEPFAMVITDLGMPNIDGNKVASAVKERSPEAFVILLTGWGNRTDTEEKLPLHVDLVLSKPADINDLRSAIALRQKKGLVS